jgi:hypothetical protein
MADWAYMTTTERRTYEDDPDVIEVEPLQPEHKVASTAPRKAVVRASRPKDRRCADCGESLASQAIRCGPCEIVYTYEREEFARCKLAAESVPPRFGEPVELQLSSDQVGFIYRLWNSAGECLYVGQTTTPHPILRVMAHRSRDWWPEVARADYAEVLGGDLDWAEECQIKELRPKYNIMKNPLIAQTATPPEREIQVPELVPAR